MTVREARAAGDRRQRNSHANIKRISTALNDYKDFVKTAWESAGEVDFSALSALFSQCFAIGGLGSHRDLEIVAIQLVKRTFGDREPDSQRKLFRLLSFWAGDLLAVCMNNSRDLGESLAERSRGIGAIFRQAN